MSSSDRALEKWNHYRLILCFIFIIDVSDSWIDMPPILRNSGKRYLGRISSYELRSISTIHISSDEMGHQKYLVSTALISYHELWSIVAVWIIISIGQLDTSRDSRVLQRYQKYETFYFSGMILVRSDMSLSYSSKRREKHISSSMHPDHLLASGQRRYEK